MNIKIYKCIKQLNIKDYEDKIVYVGKSIVPIDSEWFFNGNGTICEIFGLSGNDLIRLDRKWKSKNAISDCCIEIPKNIFNEYFELSKEI